MNLQINDEKIEVNSQQNALEINVENNNLETNAENIEINVEANPQKINLKLDSPVIHETVYETIHETVYEKDHSILDNLDFENSGHTGFQPAGNYALKSELPNVSDFITNATDDLLNYYLKSETYTKDEVSILINAISSVRIEVVATLPETGNTNIIYLVPKDEEENDIYNEFIYINGVWEKIGSTETDLTNYVSVNEQMFTTDQKSQARENIEAARDIDALKMPDVSIEFKNNENRNLPTIRLTFKNITPNFLKFSNDQAIYIHLFRRRNGQVHNKKIWNGDIKRNVKKWIHPIKEYHLNDPACSAWGVRRYEAWNPNIVDEINYSYYPIANYGIVDTEIRITATDLNRGWYEIALKDILSPIVVNINAGSNPETGGCENKVPTEDWVQVKLIGDKNTSSSKKISCVALKFKLYNPYLGYGEAENYIKLMIGKNRGEFGDLSSEILLPDLKYMVEII